MFIFPLTFVSNVFVPTETLPCWLQPVAEWNPVSALTAATRELWGNPNPFTSASRPSTRSCSRSSGWSRCCAVFAPLGVRKYRSMTATRAPA